jgi:WD40 repeat protein/serine/threonine protein kinase
MHDSLSLDEQLLQRLPLPLAQLCRRAQNAKASLERHQAAYYLWEAALKLLASVAVVEYADRPDRDPEAASWLQSLARPSLGHWWEIIRRLVPLLADAGDAGFAPVRELVLGRARDDMPRAAGLDAALLETLDGRTGARSTVRLTELIDRVVHYRNREIGHGAAGQRPASFYDRMSGVLLAGAGQVLARVDVLAGRRLLYVGEVRRQASGNWLVERYALSGETAKRIEALELPEADGSRLPRPERAYLEEGAGAPVLRALHPLVHYEAASGNVYFLNARRGKQGIEYLSYSSGTTLRREDLATEHRALLAQVLGQPVAAEAAEAWAAASFAEEAPGAGQPAEPAGRTIGEFELLSRLGQGGMGVVYRAWQPSLGRQVALKCMLRAGDPRAEARFSREIRALGRVEHANVVKVFTSGSDGDQWFYAMELIEGAELSRVCDQLVGSTATEIDEGRWKRALSTACERARAQETSLSTSRDQATKDTRAAPAAPPAHSPAPARTPRSTVPLAGRGHVHQVVEIVRQVAEAVHALHEAGIVHRDIKPGNIMLTTDGAHPVLMDLGLAQLADETEGRVTRTRQFVGTLRYASPEQVLSAGRVDRRTDVYSLGATLWELLTLRPLFGAGEDTPTPDLMLKIQTADAESPRKYNRNVPRDLASIVMKCLEKDRGRRYATAVDLSADLSRFLGGEPVGAQPPSFTYMTGKLVRRYRAPLAVAAVVLVVLLAGAVAAFIGIDQQRRAALAANEQLQEQLYANRIAVAERELTQRQDIGLAADLLEKCPPGLRGWEWHYLMRLRDGERAPLAGHQAGLWTAAFSPDGRRIATASIDGTAKVWDAATGRVLRTFSGHAIPIPLAPRVPVTCLAFSPDGRYIASGSLFPNLTDLTNTRRALGVVKIWDAETGRVALTFDRQIGMVDSVTFSPDGTHVASSTINEDKSFVVWDTRTGKDIRVVRGSPSHVHRLRYSPDGRLLVSVCTDGSVTIWDEATLQRIRSIEAHPAPIYDVAFAPDGARFATAGFDGTVRVWETATGDPALTLRGHTGATLGVAFSPDGRRLASAGYDKTVRLWDTATGEEKITLRGHRDTVCSVAFSPDGQQLVSASFDREARIWDASPAEELGGPGVFSLRGHTDRVNTVAFSRKGSLLASGSWDGTVRLWEAETGRALRTLAGHKGAVWGVAFSPDGRRIASASWDRTVKVWDAELGRELRTFAGHSTPVHCVAFSPGGKRLVSCSWEGLVKVWDAATGKETATFAGHLFPAMAVAFSPDGKRVASGSGDRTVKVWEAAGGREVFTLKGHEGLVHSVAFSPDGQRIASASWDHTVKIWNAKTGKEALKLTGHGDRVQSVAFSPDGTRIATGSEDKTVRIWDAKTGKEVPPPRLHRGVVWSVSFSPDGQRVAAGYWSTSGWVQTWRVDANARSTR